MTQHQTPPSVTDEMVEAAMNEWFNPTTPLRDETEGERFKRIIKSAITAALAVQPGSGWRPIETAPKDGTPILYRNKHTTAGACKWWTAEELAADEGGSPDEFASGWYEVDDPDSEVAPTHWHPLPEEGNPPMTDIADLVKKLDRLHVKLPKGDFAFVAAIRDAWPRIRTALIRRTTHD